MTPAPADPVDGRAAVPLFLKHAFNESDEALVKARKPYEFGSKVQLGRHAQARPDGGRQKLPR